MCTEQGNAAWLTPKSGHKVEGHVVPTCQGACHTTVSHMPRTCALEDSAGLSLSVRGKAVTACKDEVIQEFQQRRVAAESLLLLIEVSLSMI